MKSIIFDWKRTLYNPESKDLIDGAIIVLEYLKSNNVKIILVGKGAEDMHQEVARLGVDKYFSYIDFREGDKDISLYDGLVDLAEPAMTIFVGDRVRSELAVGNSLGATTIWVKQGKFASELPEGLAQQPDYTVDSLEKLISIFETIYK